MVATATSSLPPRDRRLWTLQDCDTALQSGYPGGYNKELADAVFKFLYLSDHLQKGAGYKGPGRSADLTLSATALDYLGTSLTPHAELPTRLDTRVNGACGNEAAFTIAALNSAGKGNADGTKQPTKEQTAFISERTSDLSWWWTIKGLWGGANLRHPTGVRGMVAQASASQSGQACIRAFINPASRTERVSIKDENGSVVGERLNVPRQETFREALRHIQIVAPQPERCCIYLDPDTQEPTGVFRYTTEDNKAAAEVWFTRDGKTWLRNVTEGVEARADDAEEMPGGGLLPIAQADVGCLLTKSVVELQRAVDTAVTSLMESIKTHGHSQRTEINAEEDGYWSTTPPAGTDSPRTRLASDGVTAEYFTPMPPGLGNNIVRRLVGFKVETGANAEGATGTYTSPAVHYHDPTAVTNCIEGLNCLIMLLRYACRQGHDRVGLLGSLAEASGEAYEQARAQFLADIRGVAEAVDAALAPLLTWVALCAEWLMGVDEPTFAEEYEIRVQSHPSAGPPSTEYMRASLELVNGQVISAAEATARVGIQDVAAERARIQEERTNVALAAKWDAIGKALATTLDPTAVLTMEFGFTAEQAAMLVRTDGPPNIQQ